jgi:ADP-ribosylglycohydrolase
VGNAVNCGVAMYAWPTGAIHAGDPAGAYAEAASWGMAHNESFAVEAAAVIAAAMAAAIGEGSVSAALEAARSLARDGTAGAIAACLAAAQPSDPWDQAIARIRAAVAPFDRRTGHTADDTPLYLRGVHDAGRPSRLASIEELPVALAALAWGGEDWRRVLGLAVWYGRDNDSIAGMALSIWGGAHGLGALPASLVARSQEVNRRDYSAGARRLAEVARQIQSRDARRSETRAAACRA